MSPAGRGSKFKTYLNEDVFGDLKCNFVTSNYFGKFTRI